MIFLSEGLTHAEVRLSLRLADPRPRIEDDGCGLRAVVEPVVFELSGVEAWLAEAGLTLTQTLRRDGKIDLRAARVL